MVSTSESDVTINLPLHDLALGRVSFDFWLFLRSAWPNTLRAFLGKITPSRPGVDISLLHCLATSTRNMAPKATSGPKSRGPSFATPLWDHIYKYCDQPLFFFFMAIQCSGYILYAALSVLKLTVLLNSF